MSVVATYLQFEDLFPFKASLFSQDIDKDSLEEEWS